MSVLVVFLLLIGTTWNLYFFISNYKNQREIFDRNTEIFNNCLLISKENCFKYDSLGSIYINDVLYTISKDEHDSLLKVTVSAYENTILKEKISRYKYVNQGVLDE